MARARRSWLVVTLTVSAVSAAACGNKHPPPERDSPPVASVSAPAPTSSASGALSPAPAPATIPKLVAEKITPKEGKPGKMFAVEGALMTIDGTRVGRVSGDDIAWIGEVPKAAGNIGANVIDDIVGQWPDKIYAIYRNENPRAPQPMVYPIGNKKAAGYRFGEGGAGTAYGVARVGETVLASGFDYVYGYRVIAIQGPKLARVMQRWSDAGCQALYTARMPWGEGPALTPHITSSTPAGTIVTFGRFCKTSGAGAEVWGNAATSRILPLDAWWKKSADNVRVVKGSGDELFALAGKFLPVLRYHDGEVTPLPLLPNPLLAIFTSPSGVLHAFDGDHVHRYEGGKWVTVAAFTDRDKYPNVAMDDKGVMWTYGAARLREAERVPLPEPCPKPFVYMYASAWMNSYQKGFTYPATRKALSSFPGVASLELVEFGESWDRHLGVRVADRAQGEALIAHVKATMKDEDPKLFCYEPESPRKIDIAGK